MPQHDNEGLTTSRTDIERRITLSEATVEYRDVDGEKRPVISGYAAVFNTESRVLSGFVETIAPTAFDDVLATNPDVIGCFNHDKNMLLGRTANGTMTLRNDGYGLRYEITPNPNTSVGRDVVEWVKDRTVVGSSFAFSIKKDGTGDSWTTDPRGFRKREVRSVAMLEDCGPVVRPAYASSSVVVSRRAIEMALGDNYRPNQTMANAAKRGLKLVSKHTEIDGVLTGIAERIAAREVVCVEEALYLAGVHERCAAAKADNWAGTPAWVEYQLAGGGSGRKWLERRAQGDEGHAEIAAPAPEPAAVETRDSDVNLRPTAGMAAACRRGLKLYEDGRGGDGLVSATVAWARKIAAREPLTKEKVVKMAAWHARHKVDKRPGWDKPGEESPGFVAFLLWAGAAGRRWSASKVAELRRAGEARDMDGMDDDYEVGLSERDIATAESYEAIAEEMGQWSQAESHYIAESPFGQIACKNCVFFEGEGRCYIVAGDIAPDAVCKLWIIPDGARSQPEAEAVEQKSAPELPAPGIDYAGAAAALKAKLLTTWLHGSTSAS
jgi:hypothetical protein